MITRRAPKRSAICPQTGWVKPLISTCRAMAKAKPEADQACAAVIGARNRPKLCRRPMASAAQITPQAISTPTAVAGPRALVPDMPESRRCNAA